MGKRIDAMIGKRVVAVDATEPAPRVRGYTEGVQDCIEATLLAAAYQESAGDIVAATLLRRMTEAFRHKIDSEVTSVDVMKDGS